MLTPGIFGYFKTADIKAVIYLEWYDAQGEELNLFVLENGLKFIEDKKSTSTHFDCLFGD